jgi:hypothetical protein
MKNNFVLFLILFFPFVSLKAQFVKTSSADIATFSKSTTYIVQNASPEFNQRLKSAIEKNWKVTSYEFISPDKFETVKTNTSHSFLLMGSLEIDYLGGSLKENYDLLYLVLGGKAAKAYNLPNIANMLLGYTINGEKDYLYKIDLIVEILQDYLFMIEKDPSLAGNIKGMKKMNEKNKDVKTKEIWLTEEDLSTKNKTLDEVKKSYPYKVKITSKEEIQKAIEEKKDILVAHVISPKWSANKGGNSMKYLASPVTGETYFYTYMPINPAMFPEGFLPRDWKELSK